MELRVVVFKNESLLKKKNSIEPLIFQTYGKGFLGLSVFIAAFIIGYNSIQLKNSVYKRQYKY